MSCDVCVANSSVDDELLADVVSRTSAHLSRMLPRFSDTVSIDFTFERKAPMVLQCLAVIHSYKA